MFNLKSLKPKFANNFGQTPSMSSMADNLSIAKAKVELTGEKSNNDFDKIINNALVSLRAFISSKTPDKKTLEETTRYLVEASKLKPSRPESYFYLSYIFNILGEVDTALKYFKTVALINPDFEGLDLLREDITGT